jgi:hypothetical protein
MKMLRKEKTYINLSFGLYLELMKRQTHLKRQMLHQKICNNLFSGDTHETPILQYAHKQELKARCRVSCGSQQQ